MELKKDIFCLHTQVWCAVRRTVRRCKLILTHQRNFLLTLNSGFDFCVHIVMLGYFINKDHYRGCGADPKGHFLLMDFLVCSTEHCSGFDSNRDLVTFHTRFSGSVKWRGMSSVVFKYGPVMISGENKRVPVSKVTTLSRRVIMLL